jgi:hypothetical protein
MVLGVFSMIQQILTMSGVAKFRKIYFRVYVHVRGFWCPNASLSMPAILDLLILGGTGRPDRAKFRPFVRLPTWGSIFITKISQ